MLFFIDAQSWYAQLQKSVIFNPCRLDDVQKEWISQLAAKDFHSGRLSQQAYAAIMVDVQKVPTAPVAVGG